MSKTVVAVSLGECIHVAGVINLIWLAEHASWHSGYDSRYNNTATNKCIGGGVNY